MRQYSNECIWSQKNTPFQSLYPIYSILNTKCHAIIYRENRKIVITAPAYALPFVQYTIHIRIIPTSMCVFTFTIVYGFDCDPFATFISFIVMVPHLPYECGSVTVAYHIHLYEVLHCLFLQQCYATRATYVLFALFQQKLPETHTHTHTNIDFVMHELEKLIYRLMMHLSEFIHPN